MRCLLFVACELLLVRCVLFFCLLFAVLDGRCWSYVICCLMVKVCCLLFVVCGLLVVACCAICAACCLLAVDVIVDRFVFWLRFVVCSLLFAD